MKLVSGVLGLLILAACSFVSQEKTTDFYTYTKKGDLWRVPVMEPYKVVSATNSNLNDWMLIVDNPKISGPDFQLFGDQIQFGELTRVGLFDSVIVLEKTNEYWPKLAGTFPSILIVDAKTDELYIYSKEHHQTNIDKKFKELGIKKIEMHDWRSLKDRFLEKQELPNGWRK